MIHRYNNPERHKNRACYYSALYIIGSKSIVVSKPKPSRRVTYTLMGIWHHFDVVWENNLTMMNNSPTFGNLTKVGYWEYYKRFIQEESGSTSHMSRPLRSIRQCDILANQLLSSHRIRKAPHRSRVFCGPGTAWPVDKGSDKIPAYKQTRKLLYSLRVM